MKVPEILAIASRNPGKVREIRAICADWPVRWVTGDGREWAAVPETGSTYGENAVLKGRAMAATLGVAALADDSGIEVDALGGGPGVRSARYAGPDSTDEENLSMMVRSIAGIPAGGRSARYRCVAAIVWPDGSALWAEGTAEGTLLGRPRGSGGFGYDPIFVPAGWDRTMAELSSEEKNRISHRGRAFRTLRERIEGSSSAPAFGLPGQGDVP